MSLIYLKAGLGVEWRLVASRIQEDPMPLTMADKPTQSRTKADWPVHVREEFDREARHPNGCVGQQLISETNKVRVWRIHLKPGERCGFHRHVLNYFWSATTSGKGRQHFNDGETREYDYVAGETRHETYALGEYKVHDLENIGDTDLTFVTVEFLDSPNGPLAIARSVRTAA
jgi:quercetin dioxygenase-like cupin family protein